MRCDFCVPVCVILLIPAAHGFTQELTPTHHGGTPHLAAELQAKALPAEKELGVVEDQATELDTTLEGYIEAIKLQPENAQLWIDCGQARFERGDFEKAIADFTEAIRLNPKSAAAYVQRGYLRYIKGENADAIRDYTEAIRLDASDAFAYYGRGSAWSNLRQFDKARSDYSEAIRIDPDNADFYNGRGNAWFNTGQYSRAIADYSEAIRLEPNYANAYVNRGDANYEKGEYADAIGDYTEAIRINPNYADAYVERGDAWQAQADLAKAVADYDRAIKLDPSHAGAFSGRGDIWFDQGEFDKAVADYNAAIRLSPDDSFLYLKRGLASSHTGEHGKAIADFDEAIRLAPNVYLTYYERGGTHFAIGEYEKAIADYAEAIRLNREYAQTYAMRGAALRETGQQDRAISDYTEAIRLAPNNATYYALRGDIWFAIEQYAKAIADYDEAIRLDPNRAFFYSNRGAAWLESGEHAKAMADFNDSIRLDPQNAVAYYARGYAWHQRGQHEKAIADYNEAIALNPMDVGAYLKRGLAWHELEQTEKATADFETARRLDPKLASHSTDSPDTSNETRDKLPESPLDIALSVSSEILARGYLSAKRLVLTAHAAELGVEVQVTLNGRLMVLNKDNVGDFLLAMNRRIEVLERAIRQRGYRELSHTYIAQAGSQCHHSRMRSGPTLVSQSDFQVKLAQDGNVHHGVIVESTVILQHALNPKITMNGIATANQIRFDLAHRGSAELAETVECQFVLTLTTNVDSTFAASYLGRGISALSHSELDQALADIDEAIRLNPQHPLAFAIRSQIRSSAPESKHRDGKQALEDAVHACELTEWKDWRCLQSLAAAYAETGDFRAAIRWASKTLELAPDRFSKNPQTAFALYRQGKPMRLDGAFDGAVYLEHEPPDESGWTSIDPTPSVQLKLNDCTEPGAGVRTYEFVVSGVAEKQSFDLWGQRIEGEPVRVAGYKLVIGEQGRLARPRANQKSVDYFRLILSEFSPGESMKFWIISSDEKIRAKTSVIPYPLESRDEKAGYVLTAQLLGSDGLYGVEASGFTRNEEVEFIVTMDGHEVSRDKKTVGGAGEMTFVLDPRKVGVQGGKSSLTLIGERGRVSLDLPWGSQIEVQGKLPRPGKL